MKFVISILFLFYFIFGNAQIKVLNNDKYKVQWIDQFPNNKSDKKNHKSKWLAKLLFGKKADPNLIKPNAILKVNTDSYMVLDQGNNTIFQIKNQEKKLPKAIKKNKLGFTSLVDMCAFSNNEILFTDSRLNKIFRYNEENKSLLPFKTKHKFNRPTGIAYAKETKEIWVVETGSHKISVLNENGDLIKTIGKRGTKPGEFNFPTSIWIDKSGKAYVVDAMNFRIQIFDKEGTLLNVFGEPGNATGYFSRSKGIATDSLGNIYVADALFHTVQIFDINGKFLYQFGEQGREKGQFWMPSGIFIDNDDKIYIADSYNARVQIFKLVREK
ncbi:MAG: 6-bladed beta-propeller [Flavobacteriaceae bacterium]|nr:6-bladed beta-propeller [Flavobacteriaceae bacterium]